MNSRSRLQAVVMDPKGRMVSVNRSPSTTLSRADHYSVASTVTIDSFCMAAMDKLDDHHEDSIHADPYLGPKEGRNARRLASNQYRRLDHNRDRLTSPKTTPASAKISASWVHLDALSDRKVSRSEKLGASTPSTAPSSVTARTWSDTSSGSDERDSLPLVVRRGEFPFDVFPSEDMDRPARSTRKKPQPIEQTFSVASESFDSLYDTSDDDRRDSSVSSHRKKWYQECSYWSRRCKTLREGISSRKLFGHRSELTECYMHLGHAHRMAGEFRRSEQAYGHASSMASTKLAQVLAREHQALAYAHLDVMDAAERAIIYMQKAVRERIKMQGSVHVDTVSSMHHLGRCYELASRFERAKQCYLEVFLVRQLIFGRCHVSVAVVAQELGHVCMRTGNLDEAYGYLKESWDIFQKHGVPPTNGAVKLVISDLVRVERLQGAPQPQCRIEI